MMFVRQRERLRPSLALPVAFTCAVIASGCGQNANNSIGGKIEAIPLVSCAAHLADGIRPIADTRDTRFLGKVTEETARCRGGGSAVAGRELPWVDWPRYYGAGDGPTESFWPTRNWRGVNGALLDLEYERIELIRFNLFDNSGTFEEYINGRPGTSQSGSTLQSWPSMRLPATNPNFTAVGGTGQQLCQGSLIRGRTLSGICNDIFNPLMGSTGTLFARNVE
ncbi:MAG: hypothetical protein ABI442_19150, partial [Gemmatimonadaceae bacterium]